MIHGALITNAFLRTEKFVEHYDWLQRAAKKQGMTLSLLENTDLSYLISDGQPQKQYDTLGAIVSAYDFILYWDKDILQGELLTALCRKEGVLIFNTVEAVAACDSKFETYRRIWEWNRSARCEEKIPLIPTIAAPMTYENIGYTRLDFVDSIIEQLGLPMVMKECFGSFGMQVYLARDKEEVVGYTKKLAGRQFLYQKWIRQSGGSDVRLQVVGDRVVAAMKRTAREGDFRANVTNGGSMERYAPSKEECQLAVRTAKVLGADFAGVDMMFSGQSNRADLVCEVNSNAHFKNIYTCTGVNVAEAVMAYIRERLSE